MSTRSMVNMVALIGMPVAAARIADIEVEERHALGRHGDAHLLRQGLTHCGKAYAEEGGKCYSVSQDQSFRLWLGFFFMPHTFQSAVFFTARETGEVYGNREFLSIEILSAKR